MLPDLSLIEILELVSTIATVIALLVAAQSFRKSTRIHEAIFVKDLFTSFQRDRQALLDNPQALQILADQRGTEPNEVIRNSIGSFDINRAYTVYLLYQRRLTPKAQWERDIKDIQVLFSSPFVVKRWQQVRTRYTEDFQDFIHSRILSPQINSTYHPKVMALKIVHSTRNCADTTCPTIYKDEAGNYVIQGFMMNPTDKKGIQLPEGEDAVVVPVDFLLDFVEKMKP